MFVILDIHHIMLNTEMTEDKLFSTDSTFCANILKCYILGIYTWVYDNSHRRTRGTCYSAEVVIYFTFTSNHFISNSKDDYV